MWLTYRIRLVIKSNRYALVLIRIKYVRREATKLPAGESNCMSNSEGARHRVPPADQGA